MYFQSMSCKVRGRSYALFFCLLWCFFPSSWWTFRANVFIDDCLAIWPDWPLSSCCTARGRSLFLLSPLEREGVGWVYAGRQMCGDYRGITVKSSL